MGPQAAAFASAPQLASWVGVCPGRQESAGESTSNRSAKGNRSLRRVLNQVAWTAVRSKDGFFQVLFRRWVPRLGVKKAIWAVAHRVLRLIWKLLHEGVSYEERGPLPPNAPALRCRRARLLRELRRLGYEVTLPPAPPRTPRDFRECYLEKTIRGALGPEAVVVFLAGACGDVTQVDSLDPRANPGAEQWCQLVGGRVGAEAVKVLLAMCPGAEVPLAARSTLSHLPRRVPSPERVRRCTEAVQKDPKEIGATEWTFAKEIVLLDWMLRQQPVVEFEVQALQVGPAIFLANPAEFFCQLGLDIKRGSHFPLTFPAELANGCVGYVPTEEAFGPHGGGYETRLTSYSNLEPKAGTRTVEASLALARQFTPGPLPQRPPAPPFKAPWSYGNVPPELR